MTKQEYKHQQSIKRFNIKKYRIYTFIDVLTNVKFESRFKQNTKDAREAISKCFNTDINNLKIVSSKLMTIKNI